MLPVIRAQLPAAWYYNLKPDKNQVIINGKREISPKNEQFQSDWSDWSYKR